MSNEQLEKMFLTAIYEYKKIQVKYKKMGLVADVQTEIKEAFENWIKEWGNKK